jgi:hypothetical protein
MFYNLARINQAVKNSPAMAAGIERRLWEMADLVRITMNITQRRNRHKTGGAHTG